MKPKNGLKPKDRPARKLRDLFVYNDLITGQQRYLVPWWKLVLVLIAALIIYLSSYQEEFIINMMGSSLNYFLPVFYIFIIISYFIALMAGKI